MQNHDNTVYVLLNQNNINTLTELINDGIINGRYTSSSWKTSPTDITVVGFDHNCFDQLVFFVQDIYNLYTDKKIEKIEFDHYYGVIKLTFNNNNELYYDPAVLIERFIRRERIWLPYPKYATSIQALLDITSVVYNETDKNHEQFKQKLCNVLHIDDVSSIEYDRDDFTDAVQTRNINDTKLMNLQERIIVQYRLQLSKKETTKLDNGIIVNISTSLYKSLKNTILDNVDSSDCEVTHIKEGTVSITFSADYLNKLLVWMRSVLEKNGCNDTILKHARYNAIKGVITCGTTTSGTVIPYSMEVKDFFTYFEYVCTQNKYITAYFKLEENIIKEKADDENPSTECQPSESTSDQPPKKKRGRPPKNK